MRKLAVVTGGSRGIGRAVVEKFLSHGFDVATCSRRQHHLDELSVSVTGRFPQSRLFTFAANLAVAEEVSRFCSFVNGLDREIDVLVNNAGFFLPGQIISEPADTLPAMINANLYSAYHVTRGLIGRVRRGHGSYVFNMCSIASIAAYPNGGSYAISKFALLGFSKCLREELKTEGIRVSAVLPGATLTDSWSGAGLPEERFVKADDVADIVYGAYALSERAVVEEIIIRPQLGDI